MKAYPATIVLNQTVTQLQGGVFRLGIASAIPLIAGWEQTLGATNVPELAEISRNLAALRTRLTGEEFDPAEVGGLLKTLAGQVRAVATSPFGLPAAVPLTQLSLLLEAGSSVLEGQGER